MSGSPLIFISAAEPSADAHAASLIEATLDRCPYARFIGVAGPHMVAAGCIRLFDMTEHAAMLLGVLRSAGRALQMMVTCDRCLRRFSIDGVVVVDSPTLHLPLAGRARAIGIPVLYYVAPQLWAWGAHRIHRLRNRTDKLAVVLPFEEEYFCNLGVDAFYVGHPLVEANHSRPRPRAAAVDRKRRWGHPFVAVFPGSRAHVVREVLPGQLDVARRIAAEFPDAAFGISVARPSLRSSVEGIARSVPANIHRIVGQQDELIEAADLVLVASGTTTLQVALHRRPMIVMYNTSRWFYNLIGRWIVRTPHLSLPNIIANRRIVPEFMPYYRSTEPIARAAIHLLNDDAARIRMVQDLDDVIASLGSRNASQETAQLLLDMIGVDPTGSQQPFPLQHQPVRRRGECR